MESNHEIRERIQLFSLLRAAQRALTRCMHPARLSPIREQGRQLLIQLQALGSVEEIEESEAEAAAAASELAQVDALLDGQLRQTLEIADGLEFAHLRATGSRLCAQHPDEVRALIDILLKDDLGREKPVRLLEYLITMLSTEEWNGRRTVVQEPGELTPGLRERARTSKEAVDSTAAEKLLGEAISSLTRGDDHRDLRDEIRSYKRTLGADILHPRILSRAIAYNVAMWNHIAARIDSAMAIDQLADDLLVDLRGEERATEAQSAPVALATPADVLGSRGFTRLVAGFKARVAGIEVEDPIVRRAVAALDLHGLVPREIEALEAEEDDPIDQLICSAVVLARAIRGQAEVRDALEALSVEPVLLETEGLDALSREMAATASKLFSDSRYNEAFEVSEVKTRNLAALAAARARAIARVSEDVSDDDTAAPRRRFGLGIDISPRMLALVLGPIVGIAIAALYLAPLGSDVRIISPSEVRQISPFLESGHRQQHDGELRFVGNLGPAWDYLPTPERRAAASEIGQHFSEQGIEHVVLLGPGPQLMARWQNGALTELAPKPTTPR